MQFLVTTTDCHEVDWSHERPLLAEEARAVWGHLLSGQLRNIWMTEETHDAVLLFEAAHRADVVSTMEALPLVKAGKISYRIVGLTPYRGLERLFRESE